MAFEIIVAPLTTAQRTEVTELTQKIEALNAEINKLQILRRDAQVEYLKGLKDEWTPKEIAIVEERNKAFVALGKLREISVTQV